MYLFCRLRIVRVRKTRQWQQTGFHCRPVCQLFKTILCARKRIHSCCLGMRLGSRCSDFLLRFNAEGRRLCGDKSNTDCQVKHLGGVCGTLCSREGIAQRIRPKTVRRHTRKNDGNGDKTNNCYCLALFKRSSSEQITVVEDSLNSPKRRQTVMDILRTATRK